jgi:DNA-binding transcriptional LysR family regulator
LEVGALGHLLPERELEKGSVDLVIGVEEYLDLPKRLCSRPWIGDRLVCLAGDSNALVSGQQITLEQFIRMRHVYPSPMGFKGNIVESWLAVQGLKRSIAVTARSYLAAARIIQQTDYLLSLPSRVAAELVEFLPLRILQPPDRFPGFELNLIWHPLYDQSPSLKWLIGLLDDIQTSIEQAD